jgi:hypothetical protein
MNDHPYFDEIKFSLELFNTQGFKPIGFNDGEDIITTTDIDTIIQGVLSVDNSTVDLEYQGKIATIYFALDNEPGIAIYDYAYPFYMERLIEDIHETIYNHFN